MFQEAKFGFVKYSILISYLKSTSYENFANAEKLFRHYAFIQTVKLQPFLKIYISARLNGKHFVEYMRVLNISVVI